MKCNFIWFCCSHPHPKSPKLYRLVAQTIIPHSFFFFYRFLYVPEKCHVMRGHLPPGVWEDHFIQSAEAHSKTSAWWQVLEIDTKKMPWNVKTSHCLSQDLQKQAAVNGTGKQSVSERWLSHAVAEYMSAKNYSSEAEYIKLVTDWHRASDGRGLTRMQGSDTNKRMRAYIMRMP